jgi:ribose/xylose/arabinose/galactoside ABC-type transport system permease subunit
MPPAGIVLGGGALLGGALAGAGVGVWLSGMIGVGVSNSRLKQFEQAIQEGRLLMLIDIPKQRIDEIEDLIRKHYPQAEIEGTEPTIPAFP